MADPRRSTDVESLLGDILDCLKEGCLNDMSAQRIDSAAGTTYTGYAKAGSSESDAVWQISKTVVSGADTSRTWATTSSGGDELAYNKAWSHRKDGTYTYV